MVYFHSTLTYMPSQKRAKLNQLLSQWPSGTVAVQSWLSQRGVSRQLAEAYCKTNWLHRLGRGAYTRAHDHVDWTGGVYALQTHLHLATHPAAKTALQMQGQSHFLPLGESRAPVSLFGASGEKLPAWFRHHDWQANISYLTTTLFPPTTSLGLTRRDLGSFALTIAAPERAALELLHLVPQRESFAEARLFIEGLTTLRPRLVQALLEECRSVKVKRLFMFLAEECNLPWVNKLDLAGVDFGKGKRVILKGGRFDPKYLISIPGTANGPEESGT